jgi:serine/threonine protein kinase
VKRRVIAPRPGGASPRPGLQLRDWTLKKQLDKGGNGVVWDITSTSQPGEYVMKILKAKGRPDAAYRLDRFADETKFLRENPDQPGVLPLVDSAVSTNPADLSWYVMPKAVPLKQALGDDPSVETVLEAVAAYAETLADLAEREIGHRDIKPANLFKLSDAWVIGDFGLVTYPQKDPRTELGRRLGPIDFMAPEMREDADTAASEPADVWALAKTLGVLLTNQSLPLPGTHRPDDSAFALRERIDHPYVNELDLLMQKATQIDPTSRITMRDIAVELRACLAEPPEASQDADLGKLQRRVQALTAPQLQRSAAAQERHARESIAFSKLEVAMRAAYNRLSQLTGFNGQLGQLEAPAASQLLGLAPSSLHAAYAVSGRLFSPDDPGRVRITIEVAMRIQTQDDPTQIAAVLYVEHYFAGRSDLTDGWKGTFTAPVGSAQFANVVQAVAVGFESGYGKVMQRVAQILDRPEDEEPEWWRP